MYLEPAWYFTYHFKKGEMQIHIAIKSHYWQLYWTIMEAINQQRGPAV